MTASLDQYYEKRDFARTTEPASGIGSPGDGLRFVVQHHLARNDHYDFRLEWEGALLSWAVPKGPSYDTRDKRLAVQVEDHPLPTVILRASSPRGNTGAAPSCFGMKATGSPRGMWQWGLVRAR